MRTGGAHDEPSTLSWPSILRLGLVQMSLGAVVVLMISTINRVMVVELALPAIAPGLLVASHYAVQILRPAWGYCADVAGRRTPWILFGMATLALGGTGAALGVATMTTHPALGLAIAALSFLMVGTGAGAAGTSVLALLATHVAPARRAGAATAVWVMMILGFAVTAPLAGRFLDPYSPTRLVAVTGSASLIAFCLAALAIRKIETKLPRSAPLAARAPFLETIKQVWDDPAARRFTIFIFVSMFAYSAQELLIEPFGGVVFAMSPGVTTTLAGLQHGGVLLGMLGVAAAVSFVGGRWFGSLTLWMIGGCVASAASLVGVALSGFAGVGALLRVGVFCLGVSNGAFAVAAIGSMMALAGAGAHARAGSRMGLWGAAQAIAFGSSGCVATLLVDAARLFVAPLSAYALVFLLEAALFLVAAIMAAAADGTAPARRAATIEPSLASRR